jgi:transcriptional regulator GlxA family with amidase domain
MEQNVASPLDIDLLASKLMLSPRHLQRLFEGETGRTPAAVYREIRLQHARLLIETTQLSMTDVAAAAGFCDSAHFSRQVQAILLGVAPRSPSCRSQAARRCCPGPVR